LDLIRKSLFIVLIAFAKTAIASDYYLVPKAYLDIESGKWIYDKKIKIRNDRITEFDSKKKSLQLKR
jgi:hypothetical protein